MKQNKWLLLADLHFDKRRLERMQPTLDWILDKFRQLRPSHILFLGDSIHTRGSVDVKTLLSLKDFLNAFAAASWQPSVHVLVGNHDMVQRFERTCNSPSIIEDNDRNIFVYSEITECKLDGHPVIFLPFHEDQRILTKYLQDVVEDPEKCSEDTVLFGHVALDGARINGISNESNRICEDSGFGVHHIRQFKAMFSGHFHHHAEYGNGLFTYVGSPVQFTFGDADQTERGMVVYSPTTGSRHLEVNPHTVQFVVMDLDEANLDSIVNGKDVKLRVKSAASEDEIDAEQKRLMSAGALSVKVDRQHYRGADRSDDDEKEHEAVTESTLQEMVFGFLNRQSSDRAWITRMGEYMRDLLAQEEGAYCSTRFTTSVDQIDVTNFMGICGTRCFRFDALRKGVWYVKGPNGSGKTTIADAVLYSLFGTTSREDAKMKDLVNMPSGGLRKSGGVGLSVRVKFGNGLTVTRGRDPKDHPFLCVTLPDGTCIEKGTVTATSSELQRIIGIEESTFRRITLLGSSIKQYFTKGDKDKTRAIETILGLDRLDVVSKKVKENSQVLADAIGSLNNDVQIDNVEAEKFLGAVGRNQTILNERMLDRDGLRKDREATVEMIGKEKDMIIQYERQLVQNSEIQCTLAVELQSKQRSLECQKESVKKMNDDLREFEVATAAVNYKRREIHEKENNLSERTRRLEPKTAVLQDKYTKREECLKSIVDNENKLPNLELGVNRAIEEVETRVKALTIHKKRLADSRKEEDQLASDSCKFAAIVTEFKNKQTTLLQTLERLEYERGQQRKKAGALSDKRKEYNNLNVELTKAALPTLKRKLTSANKRLLSSLLPQKVQCARSAARSGELNLREERVKLAENRRLVDRLTKLQTSARELQSQIEASKAENVIQRSIEVTVEVAEEIAQSNVFAAKKLREDVIARLQSLQRGYLFRSDNTSALQQELDRVEHAMKKEKLVTSFEALEREVEHQHIKVDCLQKEVDKLTKQADLASEKYTNEYLPLKQSVENLERQVRESESLKASVQRLHNEIKHDVGENSAHDKHVDDLALSVDRLTSAIEVISLSNKEGESIVSILKDRRTSTRLLERETVKLEAQLRDSEYVVHKLQREMDLVQNEVKHGRQKLHDIGSEETRLKKEISLEKDRLKALESAIKTLRSEIQGQTDSPSAQQTRLRSQLEKESAAVPKLEHDIEELRTLLSETKHAGQASKMNKDFAEQRIQEGKARVDDLDTEIITNENIILETQVKITRLQEELEQKQRVAKSKSDEMKDKKNEQQVVKDWIRYLSSADSRGQFRKYCLAQYADKINERFGANLASICAGTSSDLRARLDADFRLVPDGRSVVPFHMRSDGEAKRTQLSLLFTIIGFVAESCPFNPQVFFLDEIFDSLDVEGRATVERWLVEYTRKRRGLQTFIITHQPDANVGGCGVINVDKKKDLGSMYNAVCFTGAPIDFCSVGVC